jgi:thymidylate kinase
MTIAYLPYGAGAVAETPAGYRPAHAERAGRFIALEGISGSGKSTLAVALAARLGCPVFHTVPAPVSDLQPYINAAAQPLPALVFYLAGALHASDLVREALRSGDVVVDRYVGSVIANHSAVHGLDNQTAAAAITPYASYLAVPDLTVYLHTDPEVLAARMRAKPDQTQSDRDLLADRRLLRRLCDHYDQIAATDPTAYHLDTDRAPAELADHLTTLIDAPAKPSATATAR